MKNLPWFPRPLVVFATVTPNGPPTPCVQWHGQDSNGDVKEEQMLFPLYGKDAELVETVRADYWRVQYLGTIREWNSLYPGVPHAVVGNGVVDESRGNTSFVHIIANEDYQHETFSLKCMVVQVGGDCGRLYSPQTYLNLEAQNELPYPVLDKRLQNKWREAYLDPECGDVSKAVDKALLKLELYPYMYSELYQHWVIHQQHRRSERWVNPSWA